jgi:hypothetical protein
VLVRAKPEESLHYAPPDFLLRMVARMKFVRLSRKKQDASGAEALNVFGSDGPTKVVPLEFLHFKEGG